MNKYLSLSFFMINLIYILERRINIKRYKKSIILSFIFVLVIVVICIGSSYSLFQFTSKGQIHNKIVTGIAENMCEYANGYVWDFDYTGSEQEFTVPCNGTYKIETWGAQGGSANTTYIGGYGGYAVGDIIVYGNKSLYINVGGAGKVTYSMKQVIDGGYNGGGKAIGSADTNTYIGSGGGATHVSLSSGLLIDLSDKLNDIIII